MLLTADLAGAIGAILTALIGATDNLLLRRLRSRGALSPETAVPLDDLRALSRWRLTRLCKRGRIQTVPGGGFFIEEALLAAARSARRKRVLVVFAVLATAAVAFLALRSWAS